MFRVLDLHEKLIKEPSQERRLAAKKALQNLYFYSSGDTFRAKGS